MNGFVEGNAAGAGGVIPPVAPRLKIIGMHGFFRRDAPSKIRRRPEAVKVFRIVHGFCRRALLSDADDV
jgi:hypothetical protein